MDQLWPMVYMYNHFQDTYQSFSETTVRCELLFRKKVAEKLGLLHCIESSQYVHILIYRRLWGDFTFKDCMVCWRERIWSKANLRSSICPDNNCLRSLEQYNCSAHNWWLWLGFCGVTGLDSSMPIFHLIIQNKGDVLIHVDTANRATFL